MASVSWEHLIDRLFAARTVPSQQRWQAFCGSWLIQRCERKAKKFPRGRHRILQTTNSAPLIQRAPPTIDGILKQPGALGGPAAFAYRAPNARLARAQQRQTTAVLKPFVDFNGCIRPRQAMVRVNLSGFAGQPNAGIVFALVDRRMAQRRRAIAARRAWRWLAYPADWRRGAGRRRRGCGRPSGATAAVGVAGADGVSWAPQQVSATGVGVATEVRSRLRWRNGRAQAGAIGTQRALAGRMVSHGGSGGTGNSRVRAARQPVRQAGSVRLHRCGRSTGDGVSGTAEVQGPGRASAASLLRDGAGGGHAGAGGGVTRAA